ncbi:hypothetical protein RHS01_05692 [Rhizoctonia solani]|uniref:mRNA stability protein n=1 Tax=Rhizoctonia solani TaxID=456999 RepID=A0A8H7IAM0_9AGAM|nr:hypothetical protein RHS01_05692 [Rhizoctonia solani]
MLPAQRKKVDMSTMTEEEQKLFRLYGKLPTHKNVLTKVQKDRKYFDSGDYALSKAGVTSQAAVGTAIPHPENIPHVTPSLIPISTLLLPSRLAYRSDWQSIKELPVPNGAAAAESNSSPIPVSPPQSGQ